MAELEKKLTSELLPNSKIIVCRFPLPNLKPNAVIGNGMDRVWIYDLKES